MKNNMKRILITVLALLLVGGAVLPTALAEGTAITANASRITTYVGLHTQLVVTDRYGYQRAASDYKWKSSKSSVVSVNSSGVMTAKKKGSATITATNRHNSRDKYQVVIKVSDNKFKNNISKPSVSIVPYKNWAVKLKAMEVLSPSKVCVEYYLAINFPSNWQVNKLNSMRDLIRAYYPSNGAYAATVIDGYGKTVSGLKRTKGRSVQTVKITYTGSAVKSTNLRLAGFSYLYNPQGNLNYKVR